ncbi:MAG: hypothetical protein ACFFF4_15855 [Candidatus Thorarchaeota archaeon]
MKSDGDPQSNTERIIQFFNEELAREGEQGDIGFAKFSSVYDNLIKVQQEKLRSVSAGGFDDLYRSGTIVCIGVAYSDPIIDCIDVDEEDIKFDIWNKYALEYDRLNQILNRIAKVIAEEFDGIPLPATLGGVIGEINHVHDYFALVVSHRSVAEQAGIGWRGKNQLLIHKRYSCAIRFASIIIPAPTKFGSVKDSQCGECRACEDACSFIRNREILPDYRENCRRYILSLMKKGIKYDICGKCIKACYRRSLLKDEFDLS